MAKILITYDVSAKQTEIKNRLIDKGYYSSWVSDQVTYELPNTTLWKPEGTVAQATFDMQSVASTIGVQLEKAIAVEWTAFDGIPG